MYDIRYENGVLVSDCGEFCNLRKPFSKEVDYKRKKASINKLKVDPVSTFSSPQGRRFLIEYNSKLYRMNITREGECKSQVIYMTNTSIPKILKSKYFKVLMDNINNERFHSIKKDIITSIRLIFESWEFDSILTDIPIDFKFSNTVNINNNNLLTYSGTNLVISSLLKSYGKIPLSILTTKVFSKVSFEDTDLQKLDIKCPLIVCRTNHAYAYFLAKSYNGLPVIIFK